jgi:hypothetical protein
MEFPGTVQGEAARLYAGFTYRKPVMAPVDIWQLDPERLHPAHEYPRSVNKPSKNPLRTVELADYVVKIGGAGSDGMSAVHVWMQPNEYTEARKPMLVCEFRVAGATMFRHEYRDMAVRMTFRDKLEGEK